MLEIAKKDDVWIRKLVNLVITLTWLHYFSEFQENLKLLIWDSIKLLQKSPSRRRSAQSVSVQGVHTLHSLFPLPARYAPRVREMKRVLQNVASCLSKIKHV